MRKYFKKADIVLLILLLAAGTAGSALILAGSSAGQKVTVTVDGQLYGTYSLDEDREIEVKQDGHINKITIKDGSVQMSYSDCKNQICVKDGKISRTSESLVCLPNRVMIEISGGKEDDLDAVIS
ncbi:MAG: NusG domain II-containing protein [Emergencia sp.]